MDSQDAAGLGFVVAGGGQDLLDVVIFESAQAEELVAGGRDVGWGERLGANFCDVVADFFGKRGGGDIAFGRKNHGALDDVFQFANVAGPEVLLEEFGGGGSESGELL